MSDFNWSIVEWKHSNVEIRRYNLIVFFSKWARERFSILNLNSAAWFIAEAIFHFGIDNYYRAITIRTIINLPKVRGACIIRNTRLYYEKNPVRFGRLIRNATNGASYSNSALKCDGKIWKFSKTTPPEDRKQIRGGIAFGIKQPSCILDVPSYVREGESESYETFISTTFIIKRSSAD